MTNRADFNGSPGDRGGARTDRGVEFFTAEERAHVLHRRRAGQTGSERNLFTGPGYFQVDLGIFKNFSFGQHRLEFRTEIFNLLTRSTSPIRTFS